MAAAISESRVSYARHAVGNRDGGQAAATIESRISYARHAVRNRNGGQAAATFESMVSYARHAVRNRDGGQAAAIFESIVPYARHAAVGSAVRHSGGNHDVAAILVVVLVLDDLGFLGFRDKFIPQAADFFLNGECS